MTSRDAALVEELIAKRLSACKGVVTPFTVQEIEPIVTKLQQFVKEQQEEDDKLQQRILDSRRREKPEHVCPNPQCRNSREELFENDERGGQITCMQCGTVVVERMLMDKEWTRHFSEDDEDERTHGAVADPNFSAARNLSVVLQQAPGTSKTAAANKRRLLEKISGSYTTDADKRTTTGYRDKQKRKIFEVMDDVRDILQLHESVVERAKRIFARFRDKGEKIMNVYEHVAACLLIAFRERVEADKGPTENPANNFPCKYCGEEFSVKRDRIIHQMGCSKKDSAVNVESSEHGESESSKRMRMS